MFRTAIGEIVTINRCNDDMRETELGNSIGHIESDIMSSIDIIGTNIS